MKTGIEQYNRQPSWPILGLVTGLFLQYLACSEPVKHPISSDMSVSESVQRIAKRDLDSFLKKIPKGYFSDYGFNSSRELEVARIEPPLQVFLAAESSFNDDSEESLDTVLPTRSWRVPVSVAGEWRVLLTVIRVDGVYKTVDLGGAELAREIQQKERSLPETTASRYLIRSLTARRDWLGVDTGDPKVKRRLPLSFHKLAPKRLTPRSAVRSEVESPEILDVGTIDQLFYSWCWVGVVQSVLHLYGIDMEQCNIAEWARDQNPDQLGNEDCCEMDETDFNTNHPCNNWNWNWQYPGSIQHILEYRGIENHGISAPLPFEEISAGIDQRRPFIVRWELSAGPGHFVVLRGYRDDEDQTVHYWNPWPGEGAKTTPYPLFVEDPIINYKWTHTNVITSSAPTPDTETETDSEIDGDSDLQDTETAYDGGIAPETGTDSDTDLLSDAGQPDSGENDELPSHAMDGSCNCSQIGRSSPSSLFQFLHLF